jgi:hypothetical protein
MMVMRMQARPGGLLTQNQAIGAGAKCRASEQTLRA